MPLYLNYPSFIHPEIFPADWPFLGMIRWYGLMYIFAFGFAYLAANKMLREGMLADLTVPQTKKTKVTGDDLVSFIFTGILFLLLGARIGSALIYDTSNHYLTHPWLIFWPYDSNGNFTGLAGMSYHGGFIGGFIGMIIWCLIFKKRIFKWVDVMAVAIPCGYTFGRLGNFLNGELYGRVTTMPWGMVFPQAEKFPASEPWVQEFCNKIGMNIDGLTMVNLPRHPSQLYEALFEGVILFVILWLLRKHKKWDGMLSCIYIGGYGIFRFFIEYFRQPDADLGFRNSSDSQIYLNNSLTNISTGQILCFLMILGAAGVGVGTYFWYRHKDKKLSAAGTGSDKAEKNQKTEKAAGKKNGSKKSDAAAVSKSEKAKKSPENQPEEDPDKTIVQKF